MIQMGSKLLIKDNSGAKIVKCIKMLGKGKPGDYMVVSIQLSNPKGKGEKGGIQRKQIYTSIIINTKQLHSRADGLYIKYPNNIAILLDKKYQPILQRFHSIAPYEVRNYGISKLLTCSKYVI